MIRQPSLEISPLWDPFIISDVINIERRLVGFDRLFMCISHFHLGNSLVFDVCYKV
jgi:hypothetical protein